MPAPSIQPPPSASELLSHPCLAMTVGLHWGWLLHQDKTADQLPRPEALAEDTALPTILFRPQQDFKGKATQVSPPDDTAWPPHLGSHSRCKELPSLRPLLPSSHAVCSSTRTDITLTGAGAPSVGDSRDHRAGGWPCHRNVALKETLTFSLVCTCHCFPIPKHHWWLRHPSPVFLRTVWVNTSTQAQHMVVCRDVRTGQVPPAAQTRC